MTRRSCAAFRSINLFQSTSPCRGTTEAVKRDIQKAIEASNQEIDRIFDDVLQVQYVRDAAIYRELAHREITPFEENAELQQYIQAVKTQTKDTFENITQTTGYMVKNNGKLQMTPPPAVLQRALDRAIGQVLEGTETYHNAIRDIVKELTDSDLRTVNYDSGKTYDVASAARMCLMTGITQVTGHITEQNMRELGTEYVEVSWHATARPSHQKWQGRVFHWKSFLEENANKPSNNCIDVTAEWLRSATPNSHEVRELSEYTVDEVIYKVDNINVRQNNSKRELQVAELLRRTFGGEICLVPETAGEYRGIKTPDYLYRGERYDHKELLGNSKDIIRNAIHKKKNQADNFIIDITRCELDFSEVKRQAEHVFVSYNTSFVKRLIIVKGDEVISVLERK